MKERIDQLERKCKRLTLVVSGMIVLAVVRFALQPNPILPKMASRQISLRSSMKRGMYELVWGVKILVMVLSFTMRMESLEQP